MTDYLVFFRGKLAKITKTLGGAKKLKNKQMREKGWMESEIEIKPAPPEDNNAKTN